MPIKKAFYVEDFDEVLASMPADFTAADFFDGVVATMPAKGPGGENTTTDDFRVTVKKAISNWLGRRQKLGVVRKGKNVGRQFMWHKKAKAKKEQPAPPKTATKGPEVPQDGLTLLDIGKGIEALINHIREERDVWLKKYHDQLRAYEALSAEMRDLKTDKENLNRQLNKQNTEILRLTNEAQRTGKSTVKLSDVARFKTKNRGAGI